MKRPPFLEGARKIEPGASAEAILGASTSSPESVPPIAPPAPVVSPSAIASMVEQGISVATMMMGRKLTPSVLEEIARLEPAERELINAAAILSADWLGPHLPGGRAAAIGLALIAGVAVFSRGRRIRAALELEKTKSSSAPSSSAPASPKSAPATDASSLPPPPPAPPGAPNLGPITNGPIRLVPDGSVRANPPETRPFPSSTPAA